MAILSQYKGSLPLPIAFVAREVYKLLVPIAILMAILSQYKGSLPLPIAFVAREVYKLLVP
ncbi:uncharacterized protein G2W53_023182 [Senna tora]|uniref:Uncharacterized protein n=1 Tax=Senna tora TaxID=362788 RepID=A0A834TBB0_9FABA|nr:uncharacterized protein G2W53_023182 [Senna tora]